MAKINKCLHTAWEIAHEKKILDTKKIKKMNKMKKFLIKLTKIPIIAIILILTHNFRLKITKIIPILITNLTTSLEPQIKKDLIFLW